MARSGDREVDDIRYQAVAVGDTCLFLIRDNRLLVSFPLDQAAQFGNTPELISSQPNGNPQLPQRLLQCSGICQEGDLFVLATDALAKWFLSQTEAQGVPWELLNQLANQAEFSRFIGDLREQRLIRNDDTTLIVIQLIPTRLPAGQEELTAS